MGFFKALADLDAQAETVRKLLRSPAQISVFDRAVADVDRNAFRALQKKHRLAAMNDPDPGAYKYMDLAQWFRTKAETVEALGLIDAPRRRILDIGSGGEHFAALCRAAGHEVTGFDMSDPLVYRGLFEMYGIPRIEGGIFAGAPLPPNVGRYDLIVMDGAIFDYHIFSSETWSVREWAGLLEHLIANHLEFPGEIFIGLNRNYVGKPNGYLPELLDLAEDFGATVDRNRGRMHFYLDRPRRFPEGVAVWNPPTFAWGAIARGAVMPPIDGGPTPRDILQFAGENHVEKVASRRAALAAAAQVSAGAGAGEGVIDLANRYLRWLEDVPLMNADEIVAEIERRSGIKAD